MRQSGGIPRDAWRRGKRRGENPPHRPSGSRTGRPRGIVESCDWVPVENGVINEIRSFYDSARIREVLVPGRPEKFRRVLLAARGRGPDADVPIEAIHGRLAGHSMSGSLGTPGGDGWQK
jgi:hypothetical protein